MWAKITPSYIFANIYLSFRMHYPITVSCRRKPIKFCSSDEDFVAVVAINNYRIRGNFRGMKFLLKRKQTGFLRLYFRRSQVHRGKVACYVLLQISNCCKLANFHGLNFRCISRWPWNPRHLHTAQISAHTVLSYDTANTLKIGDFCTHMVDFRRPSHIWGCTTKQHSELMYVFTIKLKCLFYQKYYQ